MKKYKYIIVVFTFFICSFIISGCDYFGIASKDNSYSFKPLNKVEKIKFTINSKPSKYKVTFLSKLVKGKNVKITIYDNKGKVLTNMKINEDKKSGEFDLTKSKSNIFTMKIEGKAEEFYISFKAPNIVLAPEDAEAPKSKEPIESPEPKEPIEAPEPKDKNGGFHLWPFF